MIKVILVDDHPVFVKGLQSLFSKSEEVTVTDTFTNGTDFFKHIANSELPDVLLLDIEMGSVSGVDVAQNVLQLYPSVKVVMFSTYFNDELVGQLLETGISGYLLKSTGFPELKTSIIKVANEEFVCSKEIMEIIVKGFKNQVVSPEVKEKTQKESGPLSDREIELLKLIADEYTMKEIAEKVFLSEHTVKTHRKNLMAKLDVKNTAGLIKKGFILGLIE